MVELTRAVHHSFEQAGVRISDHHTESRRFLTHIEKEEAAGRAVPADWTWIVPPMSGAATPVFHRYYDERDQRPNFYLDEAARDLARCPFHAAGKAPVTPSPLRLGGPDAAPMRKSWLRGTRK
jgi:nitric-oxide synthase